jgi:hypothetical protein
MIPSIFSSSSIHFILSLTQSVNDQILYHRIHSSNLSGVPYYNLFDLLSLKIKDNQALLNRDDVSLPSDPCPQPLVAGKGGFFPKEESVLELSQSINRLKDSRSS